MVATRMIALAIALALAAPVAAEQVTVYGTKSGVGANNALDVNATGACNLTDGCSSVFTQLPVGAGGACGGGGTGCGLCKAEPGKLCWMFPTPVGACSAGDKTACVYPSGWNKAPGARPDGLPFPPRLTDPNCFCTGKIASAGILTIVPTNLDPNGVGPAVLAPAFEDASCEGVAGRCSDGDLDLLTGGFGVALGTHINGISDTNVGNDSNGALGIKNGLGFTAVRFAHENPPKSITPQRYPGTLNDLSTAGTEIVELVGGQAFGIVPLTGPLDPNVFTDPTELAHLTALRDEFGVRGIRGFADSVWSEWSFNAGALVGTDVDSLIVTHPCNAAIGWSTDDPIAGFCENATTTACTDNFPTVATVAKDPCGILTEPSCNLGGGIGDPTNTCGNHCVGTEYCWSNAKARTTPGYLWTRDIAQSELTDSSNSLVAATTSGDLSGKCPPDCGLDYMWNNFEQEAVDLMLAEQSKPGVPPVTGFPPIPPATALTAEDNNIGFQAVFDHYSGPRAGQGDVLQIVLVFSQTWINQGDLRCFMGGDKSVLSDGSDPNNFRRTGRCSTVAEIVDCVPFAEDVVDILGPGITMNDCTTSSTDTLDCRGCGATPPHLVDATLFPTHPNAGSFGLPVFPTTPTDPNRGWLPVDYDTHSAECGPGTNACDVNLDLFSTVGRTDLNGKLGGLTGFGYNIKVPLLVPATSGFVGSQNRDNDDPAADAKVIGNIVAGTGAIGIDLPDLYGAGLGAYPVGAKLAWNGSTLGVGFTFPVGDPGTIVDPNFFLVFATNFGPGVDGIPGCFGDNSNSTDVPPCDNPLNITGTGKLVNTGVDDFPTRTQSAKPTLAPGVNCGPGTAGGGLSGPCNMFTTQQDLRPKAANVLDQFPSYVYVGAGAGRDVKVFADRNTDFVFKFDTVFCPKGTDGQSACVGFDDPDFDRLGAANDICPSVFDPAQTVGSSPGGCTGGIGGTCIGESCLCGDGEDAGKGTLTILDALTAAQVTVKALPATACPTDRCITYKAPSVAPGTTINILDALRIAQTVVAPSTFCDLGCAAGPLPADAAFTFDKQGCR